VYQINLTDDTGKPLDGASVYTVPFEKGAMPPAKAFWSVTLYDNEGHQVATFEPVGGCADGQVEPTADGQEPRQAGNDYAIALWLPCRGC
jgi:hypothetical protein